MAVHPLRPATYHRLGGPLPHQLANRTQGSPAAFLFIRLDMSPSDFIRFYQSFPSVIPDCRASSLRVTHPSAMVTMVQAPLPHRLACVKHSVSVHPEPGSNSSFNYFFSPYFFILLFIDAFSVLFSSSTIYVFHCPLNHSRS